MFIKCFFSIYVRRVQVVFLPIVRVRTCIGLFRLPLCSGPGLPALAMCVISNNPLFISSDCGLSFHTNLPFLHVLDLWNLLLKPPTSCEYR